MVKIRPGVRPGRSCEKKKYNQDRTTKKLQKRNISHIWEKTPRKDIAMKFGTGVDVYEVVKWAEFALENLMGVNFTGGQILGFSIDCLWALTQCSATLLVGDV